MRKLLLIALLVFFLGSAQAQETKGKVVSVHDGDTFKLENGQTIRLKGVDAFELKQPLGLLGRNFTAGLILGRTVRLENCETAKDKYGRSVCDVYLGNVYLQEELVRQGLAMDYTQYSKGRFKGDEAFAKQNGLGYWGFNQTPWQFRHAK